MKKQLCLQLFQKRQCYNPVKDPKEAKFRRDLVLKNLYQNGFINNNQYLELKNKKIKLKKKN